MPQVEINPSFNRDTLQNDLAIITLTSPIKIVGGETEGERGERGKREGGGERGEGERKRDRGERARLGIEENKKEL